MLEFARQRPGQRTTPARHFDSTVRAITARERFDDTLTEDLALTNYFMTTWADLDYRGSPRCRTVRVTADRGHSHCAVPSVVVLLLDAQPDKVKPSMASQHI